MINYQSFYDYLRDSPLENWLGTLPDLIDQKLNPSSHGHMNRWQKILKQLPNIKPSVSDFTTNTILIGTSDQIKDNDENLEALLHDLEPWRKGSYNLFGIHIDTEWRSDWKWNRLVPHIQPLKHKLVLDVGCGNGYHCWRMLGAGAERVIGIDPGLLSVMQFHTIKHFAQHQSVDVLPVGIEQLPAKTRAFDTVFSMGVLYHRRSPIDHLYELAGCLKPGGELVLETLIIEGKEGQVLVPAGRYAQMRNVWFLPSVPTLKSWLKRCGYHNIRLVNVTKTSIKEQRSTNWMTQHSLSDFLDPEDHNKTIEGLPAPARAVFLAISN